ncbi:hypothetical protein KSP40_PGU006591 [Platanthera guangdongensis]|uniref:E3 ubiquitin-protein ligase n=1 Tax=Platanthera guangdongensis TaxID=2320717 RepID=A0ABR2LRL7_9ASPA
MERGKPKPDGLSDEGEGLGFMSMQRRFNPVFFLLINASVIVVLTYASEEFDMGTISTCVFWKNQSMLSLLVSLMRKHKEENNNINAETRQCSILSLIEMLLKKFAQLSDKCMTEFKHLAPDVIGNVSQVNSSVESSALVSEMERKAKARQRQAAILVCFSNLLSILVALPFPVFF